MSRVLVGVSGGIAAYKSAELVRLFAKRGDDVRCVMTKGAQEFIRPMTLQVLSENPVGTEVFDAGYESEIGHIDLARWADVMVLAPATANLLSTLANGGADDLLTTVVLATEAPVLVAPAMNTKMWRHPMVQDNVETLRESGRFEVIDPDAGELACKEIGAGRMPDPPDIVEEADRLMADAVLTGREVLVTAGPTREYIDPARMLTNPSTGRMGYQLAAAARRLGAEVTLVSGPTQLERPAGVRRVSVESAREMHDEVMERAPEMDAVCKAAAVCDWRPAEPSSGKISKSSMDSTIQLASNPDILRELGQQYGTASSEPGPFLIGFAAESEDVIERGKKKMADKRCHMMIANKIGGSDSAFGADEARIAILTGDDTMTVGPVSKRKLAEAIWRAAAEQMGVEGNRE